MTRPRAADDFATIRARIKELRREATRPPAAENPTRRAETPPNDHELRFEERRKGHPPPWVPTIFFRRLADIDLARRMWRIRGGLRTR